MRVGFFTYGIKNGFTGIGRYTIELTRAIRRVAPDTEIVLLTPYPQSPLPWYKEFEIYAVPQLGLMPAAVTLGNVLLRRAANQLELDILHDPCGIAPFLTPRSGHRRVTTVHDAIPITHPRTQPLLTRLVYHTLIRNARNSADAILTVSHHAASDLEKHLQLPKSKIHITPNGVTVPPTQPNSRMLLKQLGVAPPYFLSVGALHPRKNLGRTLQAFLKVHRDHPEVQMVVAGPPSWGAKHILDEVKASTEATNSILFLGYVDDEVLRALYYEAIALLFCSLYEGFGLPALEAMAHGTPVITSTTSSLPEVVGEAGLLVDPMSIDAISTAMRRILTEGNLRARLVTLGQARAQAFSWDATARKTLAVYEHLLA